MNLEKIAEEIKLELHDKHMMYINGEDSVTHRWCRQIIWRVLKKHFGSTKEKVYDKPIYFDVDQVVLGVKRFGIYAHSDSEAIEKVKSGDFDVLDFEVLEADEPKVRCYNE
jgi:hypothetical protein